MFRRQFFIPVLTLALAIVPGGPGLADDGGWVPLFDGQRLDGLKALPDDLPLITPEQAALPPDARKVAPQGQDKPRRPEAG
jgi:hypothetical protein